MFKDSKIKDNTVEKSLTEFLSINILIGSYLVMLLMPAALEIKTSISDKRIIVVTAIIFKFTSRSVSGFAFRSVCTPA